MLQLIFFLINGIQPLLVPICFVVAWTVTILVVLSLWTAARDSVSTAKQMHQIPCTGCQFFTDNYRLKCTVRPSIANTEEAIYCRDYQPKTNPYLY
ncbi:MAG: hypothetical protein RMY64_00350 [Nostoc sp. DedQUE08]|uniref:hypothetical protein n=1 Tax=unclassified Nostoc TaxID=2593658 RepID=UPI002AD31B11|nr:MULTISPECIES: hypothetical protein [unclassified Nostoc]MDZ7965954.1 hypothetical protein [Nostoc sp. DedSLP03]MDZ8033944.1 hypothetical protein [Nostoc sp. DedSLP04]MDZ8064080.1 hypothetical protein [Nostoc sp. DedQUE08]MDZ8090779.1 hypothetical protein [Nostoc sp. DedQUE05]MDZ8139254.1 hypothetical protein [Nostoc sp. DedQUE04]